jgi:hypothetical protein
MGQPNQFLKMDKIAKTSKGLDVPLFEDEREKVKHNEKCRQSLETREQTVPSSIWNGT